MNPLWSILMTLYHCFITIYYQILKFSTYFVRNVNSFLSVLFTEITPLSLQYIINLVFSQYGTYGLYSNSLLTILFNEFLLCLFKSSMRILSENITNELLLLLGKLFRYWFLDLYRAKFSFLIFLICLSYSVSIYSSYSINYLEIII